MARFNKSDIVKALRVEVDDSDFVEAACDELNALEVPSNNCIHPEAPASSDLAHVSRVEVMKSPSFVCHYNGFPCTVTVRPIKCDFSQLCTCLCPSPIMGPSNLMVHV